jgi:hypothetical protein
MVFHIIKENGEEFRGYIYGISDQYLVVGISRELVQKVAIEDIRIGVPEFEFDRSFLMRLRYRYRYWRGSLDLFFHVEQGAVDKRKIEFGLNANRPVLLRLPPKTNIRSFYSVNMIYHVISSFLRFPPPSVTSLAELKNGTTRLLE